jgi:serine/threonine-protein kinase HipA
VVVNALISNVDDHPRNHALIAPGRGWILAPAYDLTPNPRHGLDDRRLAMECGRFGRVARRDNIVSQSVRFGLRVDEANGIIDEMKTIVELNWRAEILRNGGSSHDCDAVEAAFLAPGFEYSTDAARG